MIGDLKDATNTSSNQQLIMDTFLTPIMFVTKDF